MAAQHAEAVSESAGICMEERLLLDGIALSSGNVSPGNVERAPAVVADFTDTRLAVGDGAAVAAGEAANPAMVELLVQARIGLMNSFVEETAKGRHETSVTILIPAEGRKVLERARGLDSVCSNGQEQPSKSIDGGGATPQPVAQSSLPGRASCATPEPLSAPCCCCRHRREPGQSRNRPHSGFAARHVRPSKMNPL